MIGVRITKHAARRTQKRAGLAVSKQAAAAEKALEYGLDFGEMPYGLRNYLNGKAIRNEQADGFRCKYRVVGAHIFVYGVDMALVTTLKTPPKYMQEVQDAINQKRKRLSAIKLAEFEKERQLKIEEKQRELEEKEKEAEKKREAKIEKNRLAKEAILKFEELLERDAIKKENQRIFLIVDHIENRKRAQKYAEAKTKVKQTINFIDILRKIEKQRTCLFDDIHEKNISDDEWHRAVVFDGSSDIKKSEAVMKDISLMGYMGKLVDTAKDKKSDITDYEKTLRECEYIENIATADFVIIINDNEKTMKPKKVSFEISKIASLAEYFGTPLYLLNESSEKTARAKEVKRIIECALGGNLVNLVKLLNEKMGD